MEVFESIRKVIKPKQFQSGLESIPLSKLYKILDRATIEFFPKNGQWMSSCFKQPLDLNMDNLPCHLRDSEWLAKMLRQQQNLYYINSNQILEYVKTSDFFLEQRKNYERKIVEWQIRWMNSGGEGWIVDDEYGGDSLNMDPRCDIGFRKGIVDTLTAIGMDKYAIEEGIEKNAHLWRDQYMTVAFNNVYEYTAYFPTLDDRGLNLNPMSLEASSQEFRDNWLKMRKYEYYQRHKDSVDAYGEVTPEMLMPAEEVEKLQEYLADMQRERLEYIEVVKEFLERKGVSKVNIGNLYVDNYEEEEQTGPKLIKR